MSDEMKHEIAFVLIFILTIVVIFIIGLLMKSLPKPTKVNQNDKYMNHHVVVCDTGYGVQYFFNENNGNLTLRVNHEGTPIRCYEGSE